MSKWINPPLHIICGRCGNKNDLTFNIDPKGNEDEDEDGTLLSLLVVEIVEHLLD